MSTVKDVADKFSMSWKTVKNIDKKYLEAKFKNIDYGNLKQIAIDEIANKKGHDYLSIVINLDTGRVIWVGEGRKEENIDKFFLTLTETQKNSITHL
ncbi:ISL3 family transposase [Candidatus Kuenenbacteria bacterium]|nr:ISL3 family transposase [Candidatus Kuenenbacteria bacterium]